eukprot:TRINITY_DN111413_c0_g1_i1.p1 TRINITY_DN111413_c0_g1~~TRINITY_DN111413_c0_g1_i1.p1  ORF type:complete len:255 (+),score=51.39 TRINITY_DN111413_c0_g1_i1:17-781(+)
MRITVTRCARLLSLLLGAWVTAGSVWGFAGAASRRILRTQRLATLAEPPTSDTGLERLYRAIKIGSGTDMKDLSEHILRKVGKKDVVSEGLGVKAANIAVKACATAMESPTQERSGLVHGEVLAMSPSWVTKEADGQARRQGFTSMTVLQFRYRVLEKPSRPPKQQPLLVGKNTNAGQLGAAILARIREKDEAVIQAAGPDRVMSVVKAAIYASKLLAEDGESRTPEIVMLSPSWVSEGFGQAYLRFRCFIEPL